MNDLSGLKIPLIISGNGKPLIILHGFMCCKETFLPQIKYFSKYFKVIVPDLRGFGENLPMPYAYDLNDYVSDFFKIANSFSEKVNVIGHSFGCRILIKAMAKSNKINKAVLCGVAGLKPKKTFKKIAKKCVYRLIRPFFDKNKLEKIFFSSDYNLLNSIQKQSFLKIVNEHLDDCLKQIKNPVFAIFGENDRETPIKSIGKKLKRGISDCTIYEMKNTGHFCFLEKPKEFCCVVKEFLL